jgi:uncharacterized protein (TIGR00369 family)
MSFVAANPDFAARVRGSFARQAAMQLIGARLSQVEPGVVGMIADSAGGYAGFTLMPADASVLTVEYKINMLAPAAGDLLIATGEVLKPGRTLSIVRSEVVAVHGDRRTRVAVMQQTLMVMHGVADEKI